MTRVRSGACILLLRLACPLPSSGQRGERDWKDLQVIASTLGLQLQRLKLRGSDDYEQAFAAASSERAAVFVRQCYFEKVIITRASRVPVVSQMFSHQSMSKFWTFGFGALWGMRRPMAAAETLRCPWDASLRRAHAHLWQGWLHGRSEVPC